LAENHSISMLKILVLYIRGGELAESNGFWSSRVCACYGVFLVGKINKFIVNCTNA
jgi:hypothetical protein